MSTDPGPPPPPPPPPVEETDAYLDVLRRAGRSADGAREDASLRTGQWRFCYLNPAPGVRQASTAVHPDHPAVRAGEDSEWWPLLSEPGLDAGRALTLVAWLMERPGPVSSGAAIKDAEAAAVVSAPTLDVDGDTVRLRGWVVYPPAMDEPFQVEVEARRGRPSSVSTTRWDKV